MVTLISPSFIVAPDIFVQAIIKAVKLSLKNGTYLYSITAYCFLGMLYCFTGIDMELGYKLGNLAAKLNRKIGIDSKTCCITAINCAFIRHWKEHLQLTLPDLDSSILIGNENGDEFVDLAIMLSVYHSLYVGNNLLVVEKQFKKSLKSLQKAKQKNVYYVTKIHFQFVLNLIYSTHNSWHFNWEDYKDEEMLAFYERMGDKTSTGTLYRTKLMLCFMFEDNDSALKFSKKTEKFLGGIAGSIGYSSYFFYDLLLQFRLFNNFSIIRQLISLFRIKKNQRKLKKWSKHAPMNYQHKYLLVEAERARVWGRKEKAMRLYDESIRLAKENEYLQEEALANEIAGRFYLEEGHRQIARTYLSEAKYLYDRWGAKAKVKHMEETYPELLKFRHASDSSNFSGSLHRNYSTTTSTTGEPGSVVDLQAVMKTSRALSSEIRLEQLVGTLIKVAVETAGAQRGILLTVAGDKIVLESEARGVPLVVSLISTVLPEDKEDLPVAIIRYVLQSGEQLILNDACHAGDFIQNPYIETFKPQSILCVPIQTRGKTSAIIYLEHGLSTQVFSTDRLEVLSLMFSQAAISLENARLYQQAEQALAAEKNARQKQEQADRVKDEFLANTSHELRTPLHGMIGVSESIANRLQATLHPADRRDLASIIASGKRLSSLVNDILDYSRLKEGDLELNLGAVDLYAIAELVISLSVPLIGKKPLQIINRLSAELPPVLADENRLQQILHNLIGNAIKFTEAGTVEIAASETEKTVAFSVCDTGKGIPSSQLDRIFNKFEQLDGSITRKYPGTGLGLAITRMLVEAQQGIVTVSSVEGEGATFTVTLPKAGDHFPKISPKSIGTSQVSMPISGRGPESEGIQAIISPRFQSNTILVVDDDPMNLQVVESQLRGQDYRVDLAASGTEALKKISESGKPDLILLDIMMPDMSGFELCQTLREAHPAYELPIIFLTARNQVSNLVEGFSLGANDYLTKPFTRDELLARVRNQMQLLQSGNKLSSLREIVFELGSLKDTDQIMGAVFQNLVQTIQPAQGMLVYHDAVQDQIKAPGYSSIPLLKMDERFFDQLLTEESNEIEVINSLNTDHAIFQCCTASPKELLAGSYWILIRLKGFDEYIICLYRIPAGPLFARSDIEYARNVADGLKAKRRQLQKGITDIKLNQAVIEIAGCLKDILYIQGGRSTPYSDIVSDPNPGTPTSVRITLQNVQTCFPESSLLRIHNSYLINPQKVVTDEPPIRKRSSRDFEILIHTNRNETIPLPISRQYTANLKQLHPEWFR